MKRYYFWALALIGTLLLVMSVLLYSPFYGISARVVLSGSMGNALPTGSIVFNRAIPAQEYRVGDVVTFSVPSQPKTTVTHRIVRLYTSALGLPMVDTKGDANPNGDSWSLSLGSIQGKKIFFIPGLGYPLQLIKTPVGFLTFALITFVVLVHLELRYLADIVRLSWQKLRA
jgi:signal peptidase